MYFFYIVAYTCFVKMMYDIVSALNCMPNETQVARRKKVNMSWEYSIFSQRSQTDNNAWQASRGRGDIVP